MVRKDVKESDTHKIISFEQLKKVMLEMLQGYPDHIYFGKIEYFFTQTGEKVVDILKNDNLIEIDKTRLDKKYYRLTPAGINLAISMINLEHSEQVLNYANKTNRLTDKILIPLPFLPEPLPILFFPFSDSNLQLAQHPFVEHNSLLLTGFAISVLEGGLTHPHICLQR